MGHGHQADPRYPHRLVKARARKYLRGMRRQRHALIEHYGPDIRMIIADSMAVRSSRVFPQHQAAITLMQDALVRPGVTTYRWLDLACGRGQMIQIVETALSATVRAKIHYCGFDLRAEYARETRRIAQGLALAAEEVRVGDLSDFDAILGESPPFDFISLTNTVHEVAPSALAALMVRSILRLAPNGALFVYDMERITPPELGAVSWSAADIRTVVYMMLDALGAPDYRPEVGAWPHSSTVGWNVQIRRDALPNDQKALAEIAIGAIAATSETIRRLLAEKLEALRRMLETLTEYGAETAEEENSKINALYEFWSLSRALGADA